VNANILAIAQINLRGNTMDHGWFQHLTLANGKPNMVAIAILSEIVYWYKPTEVRDEMTGQLKYKQKFKADMLQKNYQQLADSFGFTKRQVKEACDFLKERNCIRVEFRTIEVNGMKYNNVMFVEPVPETIREISILYHTPPTLERNTLLHSNVTPSYIKTEDPPTLKRKTNTEITTEITTNIGSSSSVFHFYQENVGVLSPFVSQEIGYWIDDMGEELVLEALKYALKEQKQWRYAEGILKRWANNNIKTLEDVRAAAEAFARDKEQKRQNKKNKKGGKDDASSRPGDDQDFEYIGM
jgi:DnaD/phage-associated family protein